MIRKSSIRDSSDSYPRFNITNIKTLKQGLKSEESRISDSCILTKERLKHYLPCRSPAGYGSLLLLYNATYLKARQKKRSMVYQTDLFPAICLIVCIQHCMVAYAPYMQDKLCNMQHNKLVCKLFMPMCKIIV